MPIWTEKGGADKLFLEPKILESKIWISYSYTKDFQNFANLLYKITKQFGQYIERTLNKTAKTINMIYAGSKGMLQRFRTSKSL